MKSYRSVAEGAADAVPEFRLAADPAGRTWLLGDEYCENPHCECAVAHCRLVAREDPLEGVTFDIDLAQPRLTRPAGLPEADVLRIQEFSGRPEVFRLLERRRQVVRAWGLIEGGNPVEEEPGQSTTFMQFSPRRESFAMEFELGTERWTAIDHYCAKPGCSCRAALIALYRHQPARKAGDPLSVTFAARFDLATGVVRREEGGSLAPEEARVTAALAAELGDARAVLEIRRGMLLRIAGRHLRWRIPAPRPAVAEPALVGAGRTRRNDPCPCGSGRKYKRCCGG